MEEQHSSCKTCSANCPSAGSEGTCGGGDSEQAQEYLKKIMEAQALQETLNKIKNKVLVFSGKGGVGKSTVSVNLAAALTRRGYKVGLLDIDFHGPSVPKLAGVEGMEPPYENAKIIPVVAPAGFKVISIGLLMEDQGAAVVWRGPMKMSAVQQLLRDVEWGELDFLLIDAPPGTGDEPLSVIQTIKNLTGAVLVTTPQQVAISDVRRSANFCQQVEVPIIGIVENMSGFVCPKCGEITPIFSAGGAQELCKETGINLLGSIPLDVEVMIASEEGSPFVLKNSTAGQAFEKAVDAFLTHLPQNKSETEK